jgi:hypothetical protein
MIRMKSQYKAVIVVLILVASSLQTKAQDFGLSFSYFIPRNGEFSTPISPFSIRGLGVDLNRFIALETGASLYRMSGLNLKGLPFESEKSLLGPNFTIFVPAELVIQLRTANFEFDIKGGGFFFYGFDQRINYGNLDRALRSFEQWEVVNSNVSFKNHPGFGYHGGFELTVYVTSQLGISLETNYLVGEAKFPMTGSYVGGGEPLQEKAIDYQDAKVDFTGLEFSIGVIFSQGGGGAPKKSNKRRR